MAPTPTSPRLARRHDDARGADTPSRRRLLLAAMFVDTFGGGLLVPFELVYALKVANLALPTAGVVLSIAAAAGIAAGPIAGAVVDRYGPGRVAVGANVLGMAGCAVLLAWNDVWGYGLAAFLLSASTRVFWAAYTPLVASVAASHDLERWFGRLRGARYIGLSTGQALSGLAFLVGESAGLRLIVAVDGISFAIAGALVASATRRLGPTASASLAPEPSVGYRAALMDRVNVLVASLNVAATLLLISPVLALPIFVLETLRMDAWAPGVFIGLLTATAAVSTMFVTVLVRGRQRLRNMQVAVALWTAAFVSFVAAPTGGILAYLSVFVGCVLIGLGEAVYAVTADALPAALAPDRLRGRYAALHQLAWGVSETISPILVAVALSSGRSTVWLVLGGVAIATAAAYRAVEALARGRDGVAGVESESRAAT